MENILEVKNLCKSYDSFSLKDVNFSLKKGSILGLIGENGAGKSTTIKGMLNLLNDTTGKVFIFGKDMRNSEIEIKKDIGVILDEGFFSEYLKITDIPQTMKYIFENWDEALFFHYLEEFKLPKEKTIKELSSGMKMKLKIITVLSHHPKLLVLDEPTTGLDPVARNEVLDIFEDFVQDSDNAILLSTHITSDLEKIADEVVFMANGEVLFQKETNMIKQFGLIKCSAEELSIIAEDDYLKRKSHRHETVLLVENLEKFQEKYPTLHAQRASLEDIMVLYIRDEKMNQ